MDALELQADLNVGETSTIEFKRCGNTPGQDTFETICAFANGYGGSIYLGVEDDGGVIGIPEDNVIPVKRNIINIVNNPNVFDPPATIEFEDFAFEGTFILRLWVPPSPLMHRYKGKMYQRVGDCDVSIKTETQLASLCIRKQNIYTEQRIFPYVEDGDLRFDLLSRVRKMAGAKRNGHPWLEMTDGELLVSAGLRGKDYASGEVGYNLAAVMLLGGDDVIRSLAPAYKTDAILRRENVDRYDDRLIVKKNLIESYDDLIEFCMKHLPDRFYLDGLSGVSPLGIIVRELVTNSLIHREFTSPFPAKLIIDKRNLRTENSSRAPFEGRIVPDAFCPFAKNPLVASFFNHIGRAEELGSGVHNLYKYTRAYSGGVPVLEEGSIFRAAIPLEKKEQVVPQPVRPVFARGEAMSIVHEQGFVTLSNLEKRGMARRSAQRELSMLVENGLLVAVGNGRSRRYVMGEE